MIYNATKESITNIGTIKNVVNAHWESDDTFSFECLGQKYTIKYAEKGDSRIYIGNGEPFNPSYPFLCFCLNDTYPSEWKYIVFANEIEDGGIFIGKTVVGDSLYVPYAKKWEK